MLMQAWTRLDGCRQSAAGAAKVHPTSSHGDSKLTSQRADHNAGKHNRLQVRTTGFTALLFALMHPIIRCQI